MMDKTIIKEPWDWRSTHLLGPLREGCSYSSFNQGQHLQNVMILATIKNIVVRDLEERHLIKEDYAKNR